MTSQRAASGARYAGDGAEFWNKGDEALLTDRSGTLLVCERGHRRVSKGGWRPLICLTVALLAAMGATAESVRAQDLEPRRWSQLPTGVNFIGVGLAHSSGDIFVDPVLQVEDAEVDLFTAGVSYVRSFGLFGRSARFDVSAAFADGRWDGLLEGQPARADRHGMRDPRFRLSVLLVGAPALDRKAFAQSEKSSTVVGAAVSVVAPLGEYFEDKLINLGNNRWTIRPQLGVTHTRGPWTYELTGSIFFFTDNDEFFNGTRLESDPLYAIQGHLIYTFRPGLWTSLSSAWGTGAEPTVDGESREAETENWLAALNVGMPVSPTQGIKLSYLYTSTQVETGADLNTFVLSYSKMF